MRRRSESNNTLLNILSKNETNNSNSSKSNKHSAVRPRECNKAKETETKPSKKNKRESSPHIARKKQVVYDQQDNNRKQVDICPNTDPRTNKQEPIDVEVIPQHYSTPTPHKRQSDSQITPTQAKYFAQEGCSPGTPGGRTGQG